MNKIHIGKPRTNKALCGHKNIVGKKYFMSLKMFRLIIKTNDPHYDKMFCRKCRKKGSK